MSLVIKKREIVEEIESFNNAVHTKTESNRTEKGGIDTVEFHFVASNFASDGISRCFNKVVHRSYKGLYIVFRFDKNLRTLV